MIEHAEYFFLYDKSFFLLLYRNIIKDSVCGNKALRGRGRTCLKRKVTEYGVEHDSCGLSGHKFESFPYNPFLCLRRK